MRIIKKSTVLRGEVNPLPKVLFFHVATDESGD
jgi:hypothetical protein